MTEPREPYQDETPAEIAELPREDAAVRDGIGEDDNPIPTWFNVSFCATIVFAAFYAAYYLLSDWSQAAQYQTQVARADALASQARASLPETNPYRADAAAIGEGQQVFATVCAVCHKADGSGLIGPSLVDPYWKYGHDDPTLFESVSAGRPGGMPAWQTQLGADKIWKALAYLETLPTSSEPGLGAPEGTASGS